MTNSGITLLTNFDERDWVTEILRSVTFKTVVFGRAMLQAPWGLLVDLPGRAVFHIVLKGNCWFRSNEGAASALGPGDTVLFPQASPHQMNDHPSRAVRPLEELLVQFPMTADRRFCYGGGGAQTVMLCGAFQLDDPHLNLMGSLLPPVLLIQNGRGRASAQLRALLRCIETELKVSRPGEQAIVTRMAEAFLLRAISDFVASSDAATGLPSILRDPPIARALALIHERPENPWTIATLAREAGLSRSAFAARFKMRAGTSPLAYLQRYRLGKGAQLIAASDAKIHDIARRVGYDSESSFSKAFKRLTGKAPGAYRTEKQIAAAR